MKSCAFFGHRDHNYDPMRGKIEQLIIYLLEKRGVTEFYSGYRGRFDVICSETVHALKPKYPQIKSILVLSYRPKPDFLMPSIFDGSVYLLEREVPRRYAIVETNKCLVDRVDLVVSGVVYGYGGAYQAVEYAKKHGKEVIEVQRE